MEVLGLGPMAYSGWSWGASIGCWLAARHPQRLSALVLLDAGYSDPQADPDASLEQTRQIWEEECAPDRETLRERLQARGGRWTDAIEEAFLAGWQHRNGRLELIPQPETFADAFAGLQEDPPTHAWPGMAASGVPILLVAAGTADEGEIERFRAAVPHASLERLPAAGHDVCRDQPDRVAEVMGTWLCDVGKVRHAHGGRPRFAAGDDLAD
jgi:pimeloyl-ACP methyl ester carboxylesterase